MRCFERPSKPLHSFHLLMKGRDFRCRSCSLQDVQTHCRNMRQGTEIQLRTIVTHSKLNGFFFS
jgi:hypothetical protein